MRVRTCTPPAGEHHYGQVGLVAGRPRGLVETPIVQGPSAARRRHDPRHLHGDLTVGIYPLLPGDRCAIDAIADGLADLGDTALVLRGGLGKRARQAVTDALAARDADDGLALVATGSYLGEGFDWPELDTLFLAFPLAFKGRVVQYVGRLLRAHEGKHHVELHDYVDSHIPVLDRMHTKRLPAYATLGFEVPTHRRRAHRPATPTTDQPNAF